jgi:16S rRNA (guanine527-N7)-methyltransferase
VETEELLRKGLIVLGLTPSEQQINAFITYLSELKKWNRVYNLTGIKKDEDIIVKHFLDSLLYLEALPSGKIEVADIGSGAGFPGMPIKIVRPEIELYLIEPSEKKSAFLRNVIIHLGLKKIVVIEKRVEDIKGLLKVDVALTRALFGVKEFARKASPIVREGGVLILSKGPKVIEELKNLKDMRYDLLTAALPLSEIKRHLVVVRVSKSRSDQNQFQN